MSLKSKLVTLNDGKEYQICALGAIKGYTISQKISKVIVKPLSSMNPDEMNLMSIFSVVVENLEEIDTLGILQELVRTVTIDGRDIDFNLHFSANYGVLIDLIFEICKFNFESLFTAGVFQGE